MEGNRWDLFSLIIEFEFIPNLKDQGSRSIGHRFSYPNFLRKRIGESQRAGSEAEGGGRGSWTPLTPESS